MTTSLEIGRAKMLDLLSGKQVQQGETVITLAVGTSTVRKLCDEADTAKEDTEEAPEAGEEVGEEDPPKDPPANKKTAKKTPRKKAPKKTS